MTLEEALQEAYESGFNDAVDVVRPYDQTIALAALHAIKRNYGFVTAINVAALLDMNEREPLKLQVRGNQ